MAFTYSPGFLQGTGTTASMFKVRRLIGDVDSTRPLLDDDEIYYVVAAESSPTYAAAAACEILAAQFSYLCNVEEGEFRISAANRAKAYAAMADRFRQGGPGDVPGNPNAIEAGMYVGGQSVSDKNDLNANSDNYPPTAWLGIDDFPGNASGGTTSF